MNHGDERNRRTETTYTKHYYTTPQGPLDVIFASKIQTVSERWCSKCGDWVKTEGLMGGMMCPECHTLWKGD